MSWFGFYQAPKKKKRYEQPWTIFWWFLWFLWFLFLVTATRGNTLYGSVRDGNYDWIFAERKWLSVSSGWFSSWLGNAVSQLLQLSELYLQNERDRTADDRIVDVLRYLQTEWSSWIDTVPVQYQWVFKLIVDAAQFDEDIISLLWFPTAQTYLVVLQNTAESRPNGWFFWSFAVVKVFNAKITNVEIIDSYILDYEQRWVSLEWPEWLLKYLPHRDIHFVGANKTWFSYVDGDHIKRLYEKVYPGEEVRWVVFLRSDMFEQLIPEFREQMRHWQFTNAATDLIRWANKFGKKELYVDQASSIVTDNTKELLFGIVEQLPQLIRDRMINLYLTDVSFSDGSSGGLEWRLRRNHLTTRFESNHMYVREANTSYNKVGNFVSKWVSIVWSDGVIYYDGPQDIVDVSALWPWTFDITISYRLWVPDEYIKYITKLEKQYSIQLEDREKHILALTPTREARWLVHLGEQFDIVDIGWDILSGREFDTPIPTHSAGYMVQLLSNESQAVVKIRVERK